MELKAFLEHAMSNLEHGLEWHNGLILLNNKMFTQGLDVVAANYEPEPSGPLPNYQLLTVLRGNGNDLEKLSAIQTMAADAVKTVERMNLKKPTTAAVWSGWGRLYTREINEDLIIKVNPEMHKALINVSGFIQRMNAKTNNRTPLTWQDIHGFFAPWIVGGTAEEWLHELSKSK